MVSLVPGHARRRVSSQPGFKLQLDATEVDEAFEVPLDFVLDPANHVPRDAPAVPA